MLLAIKCDTGPPESEREVKTEKGQVQWFNPIKGYGNITQPKGDKMFAHCSAILSSELKTVHDDYAVQFEAVNSLYGWPAIDIQPL